MMEKWRSRGLPEVLRDEMTVRDRILDLLNQEPRTIPQIAEMLGYPSREVVIWVMGMWRSGAVEPTGNPGAEGYYQYRPKE
jgi:DNA-binding IclR family transcriptional regulator